mmetsp:Transcript_70556/g.186207  ORF Transcript_70556/g.186207 Transcript_70556/m.186207 type:complete len:160 (+) Transcript_70556:1-480(+)
MDCGTPGSPTSLVEAPGPVGGGGSAPSSAVRAAAAAAVQRDTAAVYLSTNVPVVFSDAGPNGALNAAAGHAALSLAQASMREASGKAGVDRDVLPAASFPEGKAKTARDEIVGAENEAPANGAHASAGGGAKRLPSDGQHAFASAGKSSYPAQTIVVKI